MQEQQRRDDSSNSFGLGDMADLILEFGEPVGELAGEAAAAVLEAAVGLLSFLDF